MFRPATITLLENITFKINESENEIMKLERYISNFIDNKEGYSLKTVNEVVNLFTEGIINEQNKINHLINKQKELLLKEPSILQYEKDKIDIKEYLSLENDLEDEDEEIVYILKKRSKELDYGKKKRKKNCKK